MPTSASQYTLADLRRALKPLGYGLRTKRLSWGPNTTFYRLSDGHELTYDVFTPETLAIWTPLFDWLRAHEAEMKTIHKNEGVFGLNVWTRKREVVG